MSDAMTDSEVQTLCRQLKAQDAELDALKKERGILVHDREVAERGEERMEAERDAASAEAESLREAIRKAGFAVMQTSGGWSIHDVSEQAKADEKRTAAIIVKNIELEQAIRIANKGAEAAGAVYEETRAELDRLTADRLELGFASWKDGSFELIVRDAHGRETTLKGQLQKDQLETVGEILPTCVFRDSSIGSALAAEASRLRAACETFREAVLNDRHQLAELTDQDPDVTNAVLGLFDDTIGAALRPAAAPGVQSQVLETEAGYDGPRFQSDGRPDPRRRVTPCRRETAEPRQPGGPQIRRPPAPSSPRNP